MPGFNWGWLIKIAESLVVEFNEGRVAHLFSGSSERAFGDGSGPYIHVVDNFEEMIQFVLQGAFYKIY